MARISAWAYFDWPFKWNQSGTRFALDALLLLAFPLLLTFAKFVALLADSNHQLQRLQPITERRDQFPFF